MKLSANFYRFEFECQCGKCDYDTVDKELVDVLQHLRQHFGSPIKITSGNRCPEHNKAVGGAETSYHVRGRAADIQVDGVSPSEVQQYVLNKYKDKYGIGCYDSFTHIDTRSRKARW
jgi:uncharacterized protein YcbK (DUF882 family)